MIASSITTRTAKRLVTATVVVALLVTGLMYPAPAHATGDGRSQATPLPLNTPATIGDDWAGVYSLRVLGVLKNADRILADRSGGQFSPPPAGTVYFILQFRAEGKVAGTSNLFAAFQYELVGSRHLGYTRFSNRCNVSVPDSDASELPTLYPGGTITFNQCWAIPADEISTLVLHVSSYLNPDDSVWFAVR